MNKALWIIAITQVVRALQNFAQLKMLASDRERARELQDKAYEKYAEAIDKPEEVRITWQDKTQTDCPWK